MSSRWTSPPDTSGDGAAHGQVAVVTVVEVPAVLIDGPVPDAVRVPRRVIGRPGQQSLAFRSDEVIHGLRVITSRVGSTVVATTRSVLRALRFTGLDVLFAITSTLAAAIRTT